MPHPTRQAIARWAAAVLLTIAVVYPLSYGPMVYLVLSGQMKPTTFNERFGNIYAPCEWLADHAHPYRRYMNWWIIRGHNDSIRRATEQPEL